jgi:hypothetical protein
MDPDMTRGSRHRFFMRSALLVMLLAASGCIVVKTHEITEMPVAAAREQAPGTAVTVEGVATVASGTFDGGFALQDSSGGIYVTRALGKTVHAGDRVRVSGKLAAPDNQVAIEPGFIALQGPGSSPALQEVRTGSVGPATEGRLIAVRGKLMREVENDPPWGWKIYLDDGSGPLLVFISAKTKIAISGFHAGQSLRVVGLSGRYEQHTELLPRMPVDVAVISN